GQDFFPPGPDGSRSATAARRYDATGIARGDEFVVNSYTQGPQRAPAIASTSTGDFVVAWQGGTYNYPQDGSETGAFVRPLSTGRSVVAWQGATYNSPQDGSESVAFVRQFSNAGVPRGAEFPANTTTA